MDDKRERDNNFVTDLTLGLVDTLRNVPGVQDVNVVVRGGVERAGVVAWEQRNNVTLPHPLKNFYFSTDGFKFTWNYATAGKVIGLGNLEMLPLGRVNRLGSGRGSGDPLAPSLTDLALAEDSTPSTPSTSIHLSTPSTVQGPLPSTPNSLGPSGIFSGSTSSSSPPTFHTSKMFEVDSCQGYGKVVIAYPGRGEGFREGSYWFVDPSLRPHLLAQDTCTYWRLLLAHLGMPQWQALVAGLGLTPWARQWYEVVASYLIEGPRQPRIVPAYQDSPASRLDPSVFRAKRTTHRTKHKENHKESRTKEKVKEGGKEKRGNVEKEKEKEKERDTKEQMKEIKEQAPPLPQEPTEQKGENTDNDLGKEKLGNECDERNDDEKVEGNDENVEIGNKLE